MWFAIALMFGGQIIWLIAAESAKSWLSANDPAYEPPGFAARFFLGRLLTAFGPMSRYGNLRHERDESAGLTVVFWSGFALSILGLAVLLAQIA